jgi:UDP-glucose 4-epimerase
MVTSKLLMTGANGFIGAWTLRRLLERGHAVTVLDLDAPRALVRRLSAGALQSVLWRCGDVARREDVVAAVAGCDAVVHLAGVLTPLCRQDPVQGALINLVGTLHVFEATRLTTARRVVYASSAGVYGPAHARHPEPTTNHGAFKLAMEGCARSHWHDHQMVSVGLSPFVVYGAGRKQGASAGISLARRAAVEGSRYTVPFKGRAGMVFV